MNSLTLDPWRDTPPRLGDLAIRWELVPGDHMLGGSVEDVEAVLDAWNVARSRNPVTGDIAHPPLTFLLDSEGTIAFATVSGRKTVAALIDRL
jgi:cytochrome oxidase Cu insertion factor (SCO1/SenC/PrrC family)